MDGIVAADEQNRIVYTNPAADRLLGWPRHALAGRSLVEIVPPRLRSAHLAGFARYVTTGRPAILGQQVRVPARRRDGSEVLIELNLSEVRTTGGERLFLAALRDLSERVALERQVAMTSYFQAVSETAALLGLSGEVDTLDEAAPRVLDIVGRSMHFELGALWVEAPTGDVLRCLELWHAPGVDAPAFAELSRQRAFPRGVGLPGRVWDTMEPAWIADVVRDENFPRAAAAAEAGLHGAIAFPILSEGRALGVIEFFTREVRAPDPDLLGVVASVGVHLGQFIDRVRAEQALRTASNDARELAATLQASLLPPHGVEIPHLEVGDLYRASRQIAEVGGDFYDLFPVSGTTWGVVVGDVCGKGPEAATVTALARYTIRTATMRERRPSRSLAVLNEALLRQNDDIGRFITVAFANVRPEEGRANVTLSLGGHPCPLVLRRDGSVEPAGKPGTLLGVLPAVTLSDTRLALGPGDALVLYTDGVTEARNSDGEQFGEEGLTNVLRACTGQAAHEVVACIQEAVVGFAGQNLEDDIALVVLRVPDRA